MALPKHYNPSLSEPHWMAAWQSSGVYHFDPDSTATVYSIDTPPPTVSGHLHLGHTYSYTHPDLLARFWRMRGRNVYYPMGYDDNGLPTERLVEKRETVRAADIGRQAFIQKCLQVSEQAEQDYQNLWQRLGLSIDWRFTYRTIDAHSRRISQASFLELYRKGLAYRKEAPAIWCPECRTAIAQAELNDLERQSEFVTLRFTLIPQPLLPKGEGEPESPSPPGRGAGGEGLHLPSPPGKGAGGEGDLLIATTRPELLPACVAVFVHPQDARYRHLINRQVRVPLFDQVVPVIADPNADPEKGTGVVMCCTFGDQADVAWWRTHRLPLVEAVGRDGRMTQAAGAYMDMRLEAARTQIKSDLETAGFLLARQPTSQSIRVHERCDTPVEYIIAHQWFIQVLENKAELLRLGERVLWVPDHMQKRYQAWVENLSWDWCISRQRYFGVPFPLWYCQSCGEILLADPAQLPVDPQDDPPPDPCPRCGSASYLPEEDIFDTWATSSMTPQIVGRQGDPAHPGLFERVFPFSLRPQAHEIIRTWAFYTITKSHYQHARLPWQDVLISGWGLAGEGTGKISKSRGGGPMAPLEMIQRYSADAVRYWAASTGPGKDSVIAEEKIQLGAKLVTKLWNVARFSERFIAQDRVSEPENLSPADRWALSRLQKLVRRATELLEAYEYAAAKAEIEAYFWTMADNYLEMAKQRLYDPLAPGHAGARFTLRYLLETLLKLFAPYLPFITEEIYQGLFGAATELRQASLHRQAWPVVQPVYEDNHAEQFGDLLIAIASAVRRYKSERNLSLGTELAGLQLAVNPEQVETLQKAATDLMSICRVRRVELVEALDPGVIRLQGEGNIQIGIEPPPIDINPVKG